MDFQHAFRVGVGVVRGVGRALMKRLLVNRVSHRVRENACGQAGDEFFHLVLVAAFDDIEVDGKVTFKHDYLVVHVFVEPADIGSQMDDVVGAIVGEHLLRLFQVSEIILARRYKGAVVMMGMDDGVERATDKTGAACD